MSDGRRARRPAAALAWEEHRVYRHAGCSFCLIATATVPERSFVAVRRRTKVIGRFGGETSAFRQRDGSGEAGPRS